MLGTASEATTVTITAPTANHKVPDSPSHCVSGPTRANPTGTNATDPSQSNELTRDNSSGGISRCTVVPHNVSKPDRLSPDAKAHAATTASGARTARAAIGA